MLNEKSEHAEGKKVNIWCKVTITGT